MTGPLDIKSEISSSLQAVELLGKSCDLDVIAAGINPSPNPYLTKKTLFDEHLFGRAWENKNSANGRYDLQAADDAFSYDDDQSLEIFDNAAFYNNMPATWHGKSC